MTIPNNDVPRVHSNLTNAPYHRFTGTTGNDKSWIQTGSILPLQQAAQALKSATPDTRQGLEQNFYTISGQYDSHVKLLQGDDHIKLNVEAGTHSIYGNEGNDKFEINANNSKVYVYTGNYKSKRLSEKYLKPLAA